MTFDKVREILVENLGVSEDEVALESHIQNDLGADSLDIVEIVMSVEEVFGVAVEEDHIRSVKTVQDLVTYIDNHKN